MCLSKRLFDEAFNVPRDLRSDAYKAGVLALLRKKEMAASTGSGLLVSLCCPFPPASAEKDAFYAGVNEGNSIWRRHVDRQEGEV